MNREDKDNGTDAQGRRTDHSKVLRLGCCGRRVAENLVMEKLARMWEMYVQLGHGCFKRAV